MILSTGTIRIELGAGPDAADITGEVARIVADSGVGEGQVTLCSVGSTGSLTTIEYEPGAVSDYLEALSRLAPPGARYAHEEAWHDGNGHSHVQAALAGPSLAVAVRRGRLALGTWQQIIVVNHDLGARRRTVEVTVVGLRP